MTSALVGEFGFAFAFRIVIVFGSLLALVGVRHFLFAIRPVLTRIVSIVVTSVFAMRLIIIRAWLVCGFVVSHNIDLFVV